MSFQKSRARGLPSLWRRGGGRQLLWTKEKDSKENVHHIKYLYDPKDKECQNEEKKGAKGWVWVAMWLASGASLCSSGKKGRSFMAPGSVQIPSSEPPSASDKLGFQDKSTNVWASCLTQCRLCMWEFCLSGLWIHHGSAEPTLSLCRRSLGHLSQHLGRDLEADIFSGLWSLMTLPHSGNQKIQEL